MSHSPFYELRMVPARTISVSDAQFSRAAQMMNAIREASTRMHEGVTLRQVLIQEKVIPEHLTDYISDEMN